MIWGTNFHMFEQIFVCLSKISKGALPKNMLCRVWRLWHHQLTNLHVHIIGPSRKLFHERLHHYHTHYTWFPCAPIFMTHCHCYMFTQIFRLTHTCTHRTHDELMHMVWHTRRHVTSHSFHTHASSSSFLTHDFDSDCFIQIGLGGGFNNFYTEPMQGKFIIYGNLCKFNFICEITQKCFSLHFSTDLIVIVFIW